MQQTFPTLTTVWCDCCDQWFIDPVGALVIEDAVRGLDAALAAKERSDAAAWRQADRVMEQTLQQMGG